MVAVVLPAAQPSLSTSRATSPAAVTSSLQQRKNMGEQRAAKINILRSRATNI
jgi:hypothetical protein